MIDENSPDSPIEAQLAAPPTPEASAVQSVQDTPAPSSTTNANPLLHNRMAVFAMLFLVTGVLGIPLLWMNKNFSNSERIFWAIVVTIYTALLIFIAAAIVMWSWRQIFG